MQIFDSDRGIFFVTIFRTILLKMIYHIMVLDHKQMFDSKCLFQCLNDLYEAGLDDDIFPLLYEANRENLVAVNTPHGLSKRELIKEIVMQGDVLAPLISSLQVDTMGKECLEENKHLYMYKDTVPIPPLGLVDDLFTISTCGFKTTQMNQFINNKTAEKRLQFGTGKCIKLHVGRSQNETICRETVVDSWKVEVETDEETGVCTQSEYYGGPEVMKVKQEQVYLGDVISTDGKHTKNVMARKNKGLGVITQIMQILDSVVYGKYFFEVAMVLRSSMLLSSLLLNSEAWVNLSEKDIRALERTDEMLLSKILGSETNTSNTFKYLELGIYPIRFEIMKRKVTFLQYILKQEKESMVYKVFKATSENPVKNDFVKTCLNYLESLDIKMSFEDIGKMSNSKFKQIVKQKTEEAGFKYLLKEKMKQKKIAELNYNSLSMQEYLVDGSKSNRISRLIFKARGRNLEIKAHKKWRYEDDICVGCGKNVETEDELLQCEGLREEGEVQSEKYAYSWFFGESVTRMVNLAMEIEQRLKIRKKILDDPG